MGTFNHFLHRNRHVIFWVVFLFLYAASITYAVPPSTKYGAGETLDPGCVPGSSNCTVEISGGNSLYTANGTLLSDRTVDLNNKSLAFQSGGKAYLSLDPANGNYTFGESESSNSDSGVHPYDTLVLDENGKLYGTAYDGGANGYGTIFSYDPDTHAYVNLHDFDSDSGANPQAGLTIGPDGKLYGVASNGGTAGYGVIFSYDPDTETYADLHDFDYANGAYPYATLTLGPDGKLYGNTYGGGGDGYGIIFSYDPDTDTFADLHDFDYANGAFPYAALTLGSDNKFYGTAGFGGGLSYGVLFSFDPSDDTYANLHDFDGDSGAFSYAPLAQGTDGKFYGTTDGGGANSDGVIFSYDPDTETYADLYDFNGDQGANPYYGGLLWSEDTNLFYGTTAYGAFNGVGIIFSFDPSDNEYNDVYEFTDADGQNPFAGLTASGGSLTYGVTTNGGNYGVGTIFSFDTSDNNLTKLYNFNGGQNSPATSLEIDAADNGLSLNATGNFGTINLNSGNTINYSANTHQFYGDIYMGASADDSAWSNFDTGQLNIFGSSPGGGGHTSFQEFSPNDFQNPGLNDATFSGTYSGSTTDHLVFYVQIDSTGSPDTFQWAEELCDYSTGDCEEINNVSNVPITGSSQLLANGIRVTFGSTTGHTQYDAWSYVRLFRPNGNKIINVISDSAGSVFGLSSDGQFNLGSQLAGVYSQGLTSSIYGWNSGLYLDNNYFSLYTDNIGIDTDSEDGDININGYLHLYNGLRDSNGDLGDPGQILSSNGSSGVVWIDSSGGGGGGGSTPGGANHQLQFNDNGDLGGTSDGIFLAGISGGSSPELVTNGDFTGGADGWNYGLHWDYGTDAIDHNFSGGAGGGGTIPDNDNELNQAVDITAGDAYVLSYDETTDSVPAFDIALGNNSGNYAGTNGESMSISVGVTGSNTFTLLAGSDDSVLRIVQGDASSDPTTLDNISLKHATLSDGTEEILNGDFSSDADNWLVNGDPLPGAGWSWTATNGGEAVHDPGVGSVLFQSGDLGTDNGLYKVSANIGGTAGTVWACLGGEWDCQQFSAGAGDISFFAHWNSASGDYKILFEASSDFDGSIDNVSVKEQIATTEESSSGAKFGFGYTDTGDLPSAKVSILGGDMPALNVSGDTYFTDFAGGGNNQVLGVDNNGQLKIISGVDGLPGGSNHQLQFNDGGIFGGSLDGIFDGASVGGGTELVSNGDFSDGDTGWNYGVDWVLDGDALSYESGSGTGGGGDVPIFADDVNQEIDGLIPGDAYVLSFDQTTDTEPNFAISIGGTNNPAFLLPASAGSNTVPLIADSDTDLLDFVLEATSTTITNISLKHATLSDGSEMVSNGSFTGDADGWTSEGDPLPSHNWSYDSNDVVHAPGDDVGLDQDIGIGPNTLYKVMVDIGGTAGTLDVCVGSNCKTFDAGAGAVTFYSYALPDDGGIHFLPSSDFDGSIDDVSVTEETATVDSGTTTKFGFGYTDVGDLPDAKVSIKADSGHPALNILGDVYLPDFAGGGDQTLGVDNNGKIKIISGGGSDFYSTDGSLTSDRTVDLNGKNLSIQQSSYDVISVNQTYVDTHIASPLGTGESKIDLSQYAGQEGFNIESDNGVNDISISGDATASQLYLTASSGIVLNGLQVIQADGNYNFTVGQDNALPSSGNSNFFGYQAGYNATSANDSNFFGYTAGLSASIASYSNFFGYGSGYSATSAAYSNFLGYNAGYNAMNAGTSNFLGPNAGNAATNAYGSNFFGEQAGANAIGATYSNFLGHYAGVNASSASYSNLFGYQTGLSFTSNHIGSNNIVIGTNISLPDATANAINIGGILFGSGTYSTTTGSPSIVATSGAKIGIGVVSPGYRLDVQDTSIDGNIFALTDSDGSCLHNPEAGSEIVSCSSDARLKTNITDASSALDYFSDFRIRDYDIIASGDHTTGVIAQEIMETHPELVTTAADGTYLVQLPNQWKVIKAIQELDLKIADVENLAENTDPGQEDNSFVAHLRAWFANIANNISDFYAKRLHSDEVCISKADGSEVCVTGDQLENLLDHDGAGGGSATPPPQTPPADDGSTPPADETPPADDSAPPADQGTPPDSGDAPQAPADDGSTSDGNQSAGDAGDQGASASDSSSSSDAGSDAGSSSSAGDGGAGQ